MNRRGFFSKAAGAIAAAVVAPFLARPDSFAVGRSEWTTLESTGFRKLPPLREYVEDPVRGGYLIPRSYATDFARVMNSARRDPFTGALVFDEAFEPLSPEPARPSSEQETLFEWLEEHNPSPDREDGLD